MKILFSADVPNYFIAGSTTFMKQLANRLYKRGHEVSILCASRNWKNESYMDERIRIFGISSFPSLIQNNLRIAFPIGVNRQIIHAFEQFQPDIIHVQSHGPLPSSVTKVAKQFDLPTIGTNHFVPENIFYHLLIPKMIQPVIRRLMWKHCHAIFRRLDCITTPTKTAGEVLKTSGFDKYVITVSNGIDLPMFNVKIISDSTKDLLRQKYNIRKIPTLLSVGRLDPEKNMKNLIKSIPMVLKEMTMQLIIVGTGTESKYLKKLVKKLNLKQNIIFTDYIPNEDLITMYGIADCFVMPGTAELQGISLMEAMASGLPAIAANAMALPELVKDGVNGFLFPYDEISTLAKCIVMILKDKKLQKKMGERSLEVIKNHSLEHTVDLFESIYKDLAQRNSQEISLNTVQFYPINRSSWRMRTCAYLWQRWFLKIGKGDIEGLGNVAKILKNKNVIIATTHISDADVGVAVNTLGNLFNIGIANQSVHHSWHSDFVMNIVLWLSGRDRFLPIDFTKTSNGKRGVFNPDNFPLIVAAMEQKGFSILMPAHSPCFTGKLPNKGGLGAVYLGQISKNSVLLPVAIDVELSNGEIFKGVSPFNLMNSALKVRIVIGEPFDFPPIEDIEIFPNLVKKKARTESEEIKYHAIHRELTLQSGELMRKIAKLLPDAKRGKWN